MLWFFWTDRPGLKNIDKVRRLNAEVLQTLQRELTLRPPPGFALKGDVSILSKLLNQRHVLRSVWFRIFRIMIDTQIIQYLEMI
jgi:hypothetical protein